MLRSQQQGAPSNKSVIPHVFYTAEIWWLRRPQHMIHIMSNHSLTLFCTAHVASLIHSFCPLILSEYTQNTKQERRLPPGIVKLVFGFHTHIKRMIPVLDIAKANPRIPLPIMALLRLKMDIPNEVFPSNCGQRQTLNREVNARSKTDGVVLTVIHQSDICVF